MKTTTTRCDKCGSEILEGGSVLSAEAGGLRRRRGPVAIDLCGDCAESFLDWLSKAPGREAEELESRGISAGANVR